MSRSQVKAPAPAPTKATSWKDRLSEEDYNELRDTFNVFDEDGSGTIDPVEINKALEELGIDKRNPFILNLIHALRDKNKPLTLEEYLEIVGTRVGDFKTKDGLKRIFAIYDANEDGFIEYEEFKAIAKWIRDGINDDELLEMLHSAHVNHKTSSSEGFNFEEFERIVSKFANK